MKMIMGASAFMEGRAMLSVFGPHERPLVNDVEWGSGFWRRTCGLIGIASLGADHGLVLAPCRAIHTGFMRFPLDVIFFSREGRVVRMAARVKPFRFVWGGCPSWGALEMQSGWFPWANLKEGDRLIFRSKDEIHVERKASSVERWRRREKNSFLCAADSIE